jgi:hypothetical protein
MTTTINSLDACDVVNLRVTGDHQVTVHFKDGFVAELHLAGWLASRHGPMVEPLKSPAYFAQVTIDDGVLSWPNGYDLDPSTVRHWAENGIR